MVRDHDSFASGGAIPPGWHHNPSGWRDRAFVIAVALLGCGIATYLGLYQLNVIPSVWEPFFGSGSYHILKQSALARLLPVPDALLGAAVYFVDAVVGCIGSHTRWRTLPWAALVHGLIAIGLALAGILLVLFQAFLFRAFCTFCLASAGCSIAMVGFVVVEAWASWQFIKREREAGHSAWNVLFGRTEHRGAND